MHFRYIINCFLSGLFFRCILQWNHVKALSSAVWKSFWVCECVHVCEREASCGPDLIPAKHCVPDQSLSLFSFSLDLFVILLPSMPHSVCPLLPLSFLIHSSLAYFSSLPLPCISSCLIACAAQFTWTEFLLHAYMHTKMTYLVTDLSVFLQQIKRTVCLCYEKITYLD